jgi:hypothetical protein
VPQQLERCPTVNADSSAHSLGLYFAACTADTHHTHEELTEAIVQFVDMVEHTQARMVRTVGCSVHAVPTICLRCVRRS